MKNLFVALTVSLAATAAFGQTTIEQIAPSNSVVILGVKNVNESLERLKGHPLFAMFEQQGEDAAAGNMNELIPDEIGGMLAELGFGEGPMPRPQGAVGALYAAMDPELGLPEPAFLIMADFGDQADVADDRFTDAIRKAAERENVRVEEREVGGHLVFTIHLPQPEEEDLDEWNQAGMGMMPDPSDFFGELETLHFVRAGSTFLLGSDASGVTNGLRSMSGEERQVLSGNRSFKGVKSQIGSGDAYFVVLTRDLMQLTTGVDPMGMAMMVQPMVKAFFGDIQGFGYGADLEGDRGMEQHFSLFMPNGKAGITKLLDRPSNRSQPPDFINADVVSYSAVNLDVGGIVPFVDEFLQTNPMLAQQAGGAWMEIKQQIGPVLETLGSRMHVVSAGSDGSQPLMAVECSAPEQLARLLGESGGAEVENVAGGRIYTMDAPMIPAPGMMPAGPNTTMSVGLNDRWVFMGTPDLVRGVMTPAGQTPLAADIDFQRTVASLPKDGLVSWGYSNLGKFMERSTDFQQLEGNPEMAGLAQWMQTMSAPSVWYLRSTENGFVGSMYQTPTAQAAHVEE